MICSFCGKENDNKMNYCVYCGKKLLIDNVSNVQMDINKLGTQYKSQGSNNQSTNDVGNFTKRLTESPKKSYMPILFAIIGTTVVLTSIYFLFLKNDKSNNIENNEYEYVTQKEIESDYKEIEQDNSEENNVYEKIENDEKWMNSENVDEEIDQNSNSNNEESVQESQSLTPFYGIWCMATKKKSEAAKEAKSLKKLGLEAKVFVTTDWSNLNSEKWYVVSAGVYKSEDDANAVLDEVKKIYPSAYVKYSGDRQE